MKNPITHPSLANVPNVDLAVEAFIDQCDLLETDGLKSLLDTINSNMDRLKKLYTELIRTYPQMKEIKGEETKSDIILIKSGFVLNGIIDILIGSSCPFEFQNKKEFSVVKDLYNEIIYFLYCCKNETQDQDFFNPYSIKLSTASEDIKILLASC